MAGKKKTGEKTSKAKAAPKKKKAPVKKTPKQEAATEQQEAVSKKVGEEAQEQVEEPTPKVLKERAEVPKVRCVSCGVYIAVGDGSVNFPCPDCGELTGRCANCRALGRMYTCTCGFIGP